LLIAYVLVVGFVGLGGQVYGENTAVSDITVTASETRVTVWDFSIVEGGTNTTIISEGNVEVADHTVDLANDVDDVFISLKVFDEEDVSTAINQGEVWINSTEPAADPTGVEYYGAAISQYNNVWDVTESGTEAYLNMTWTGEDTNPFLLIGDWEIESVIRDADGIIYRDDYATLFDVALYRTISTSGGIEGTASPGQTLGTDVGWTSVDQVTFSINDDYHLMDDVTDLTHTTEDYTISSEEWTTNYGTIGDGEPSNGAVFEPGIGDDEDSAYTLSIPEGQEPGTYEGTITHNLNQGSST